MPREEAVPLVSILFAADQDAISVNTLERASEATDPAGLIATEGRNLHLSSYPVREALPFHALCPLLILKVGG
jgi:hypothetical protein